MKLLLSICTLFFCVYTVTAQKKEVTVSIYSSSEDFLHGKISTDSILARILIEKDSVVAISKFSDLKNGNKRINEFPWAILLNNFTYVNFRYSPELQGLEAFVKPNITGKYCAVFANKQMVRMIASRGANYGGGLTGALIGESQKWGKNWTSKEGEVYKIFVVQTDKLEKMLFSSKEALWKILTRKNINDLLGLQLTENERENLNLDQLESLIRQKNKDF